MEEAFRDADVVYPKSWAPFGVMQRRTPLLKVGDREALKALEKECLANNARFKAWECDEAKMRLTRGGKALYMHCLPADISGVSCAQGEVSRASSNVPDRDLPRGKLQAVRHRCDDPNGPFQELHSPAPAPGQRTNMSQDHQKIHPDVTRRTAKRCRERGVVIPTFAQLRDPTLIPAVRSATGSRA
jgi:hypothetical protein